MREVKKVKAIKPMFTRILTTCNKESESNLVFTGTKIYDASKVTKKGGDISMYQEVLEVGDTCRTVKKGDIVAVNIGHFAVRKYDETDFRDNLSIMENKTLEFRIPTVEVDGKQLMYIDEADIMFVVTDWE